MNGQLAILKVDRIEHCPCSEKKCSHLLGTYISPATSPVAGQIVASVINYAYGSFDDYRRAVKAAYKGSVIRQANKADRERYECRAFNWNLYVKDVYDINHSMPIRSGGRMRANYLVEPNDLRCCFSDTYSECWRHWNISWGIFSGLDRLRGYVKLRRCGDFVYYSQILGHGDHLKHGIMYRLHFAIMDWLKSRDQAVQGIKYVMYCGQYQGNAGLQMWKKKTLFKPTLLVSTV